ncbi:MAG: outer membrane lipoprotein-sorting protein [Oligoflexia bacterium]|nr:outer membrane lipoprotein-sorting protein [Oligoflexia bacterium]
MSKIILTLFIFLQSIDAYALSADEIMKKNEEAKKNKNITTKAYLITGGGGKAQREKEFSWWRKLSSDTVHFKTLTRFHKPAEVKDEGVLFLEDKETEILIYLPAYKKVRRVETAQQSGSFMGSEFSYADITSHQREDYNYKLLKEEKCDAFDCYVIESTPKTEDVIEKTGSARGVVWVRKDNFVDVKAEIFDLEKKPWKKLVAKEIKMIDEANKKWMAMDLKMENLKTGRFTNLKFEKVDVTKIIPDSIFKKTSVGFW